MNQLDGLIGHSEVQELILNKGPKGNERSHVCGFVLLDSLVQLIVQFNIILVSKNYNKCHQTPTSKLCLGPIKGSKIQHIKEETDT